VKIELENAAAIEKKRCVGSAHPQAELGSLVLLGTKASSSKATGSTPK